MALSHCIFNTSKHTHSTTSLGNCTSVQLYPQPKKKTQNLISYLCLDKISYILLRANFFLSSHWVYWEKSIFFIDAHHLNKVKTPQSLFILQAEQFQLFQAFLIW